MSTTAFRRTLVAVIVVSAMVSVRSLLAAPATTTLDDGGSLSGPADRLAFGADAPGGVQIDLDTRRPTMSSVLGKPMGVGRLVVAFRSAQRYRTTRARPAHDKTSGLPAADRAPRAAGRPPHKRSER